MFLQLCGGSAALALIFDDVTEALAIPRAGPRLFGKPQFCIRRCMGYALARADSIELARARAQQVPAAGVSARSTLAADVTARRCR